MIRPVRRERGIVLVISLVMLLAVTLMVVTSSNLVQSNLQVVSNMESRERVRYAGIAAIEEAMSSDRFVNAPENIFSASCEQANRLCYDVDGDGNNRDAIIVDIAEPECVSVTPIPNSDLDAFGSAADASCYLPPAVFSMCADSVWEFEATAADRLTGAEIVIRQGVSIRTTLNNIDSSCPTT
jgi:hypothetical protein